jgi:hypothetical protein
MKGYQSKGLARLAGRLSFAWPKRRLRRGRPMAIGAGLHSHRSQEVGERFALPVVRSVFARALHIHQLTLQIAHRLKQFADTGFRLADVGAHFGKLAAYF